MIDYWQCTARLSLNHTPCGYRITDEEITRAKFDNCPRCGESMKQYMMPVSRQDNDDE